jgi:hypothetical protein
MPAPIVVGADVTKAYTAAQLGNIAFRPGQIYFDESGNPHVFIKYDQGSGAVAGTAGLFVCQQDNTYSAWDVTADLDDADALVDLPVGQLRATLANDEYGFAQCKGLNRVAITTDGSIARNSIGVLTTGDGTIQAWATGQRIPCGTARADDSSTTLAIGAFFINCPSLT